MNNLLRPIKIIYNTTKYIRIPKLINTKVSNPNNYLLEVFTSSWPSLQGAIAPANKKSRHELTHGLAQTI